MTNPTPELSAASEAVLELPHIAQLALPAASMPNRPFNLLIAGSMPDDSASIGDGTAEWHSLVDAHNLIVERLLASPFASRILFYTRLLSGKVINDFARAKDVVMLGRDNFHCTFGQTPLTEQAQMTMGAMLRMAAELRRRDSTVRMNLALYSDGKENVEVSEEMRAATVALAEDFVLTGNGLIGVGITSPRFTPEQCNATFSRLGVKRHFAAGDPEAMEAIAADFVRETLALMPA